MKKKFTSDYVDENQGCYKGTKKTDKLLKKTGESYFVATAKRIATEDFDFGF